MDKSEKAKHKKRIIELYFLHKLDMKIRRNIKELESLIEKIQNENPEIIKKIVKRSDIYD